MPFLLVSFTEGNKIKKMLFYMLIFQVILMCYKKNETIIKKILFLKYDKQIESFKRLSFL